MKFICLGYFQDQEWSKVPQRQQEAMMEECFQYDDVLRRGGHFAGGEALQGPQTTKTLRMKDGQVMVTDGPFAETKEQLGGFLVLEARDMEHALQLMSKHPAVRIGPFEIRPVDEAVNALIDARTQRVAKTL